MSHEYNGEYDGVAENREKWWRHAVGDGWQRLLVDPLLEVWRKCPECQILQVKEKFGGLRIYVAGPEWWHNLAEAVCESAHKMCEDCGHRDGWGYPGDISKSAVVRLYQEGWWRTLCEECEAKRAAIEEERLAQRARKKAQDNV